MMVTSLASTSKPASSRETSLATIKSICFFSRFAAARWFADVAHGIYVFVGRTSRHKDALSAQRTWGPQYRFDSGHDLVRLCEAALANPAASQIPIARFDEVDAARHQRVEIPPDGLVLEHVGVHRRREQHRRTRGGIERREEIVREAVREFGDDVGGGRRDEEKVDRRGERDVFDVGVGARRELIRDDLTTGDRLEGDRPDKAG